MALNQIPGYQSGFIATRVSSMNKKALGKLTDSNHMHSLHMSEPSDYDKKIISLYTQTSLYANDFLQMLQKSTPFYLKSNSDYWKWDVAVPYQYPKITGVPDTTLANPKPGIDGQEFQFFMDTDEFQVHSIITGDKRFGQQFYIITDPTPVGRQFLYTATLVTQDPLTEFVDPRWLLEGVEYQIVNASTGEFDQEGIGLGRLGDKITLYESLGSAMLFEHTITKWADERTPLDSKGQPLDIIVYANMKRNEIGQAQPVVRWEPFIEAQLRKRMMELKMEKMIWSKPGTVKSRGGKQELKKVSAGVYHRMRNNGNLVPYNQGEFSVNLLRDVFGDLFYRREDIKNRRVQLFTNEAGMEIFRTAAKDDLLRSGLTVIADERFIEGSGQNMTFSWAFDSMVTMETGRITVSHLRELDLPQNNTEFGRNKKSTPVFMVFDVSPTGDGSLQNNIREVRHSASPNYTWGYIDGRQSHLGHAASQGMASSSMFPGYKIWMEDRCDVFIEDLTRTVLIEQVPQF